MARAVFRICACGNFPGNVAAADTHGEADGWCPVAVDRDNPDRVMGAIAPGLERLVGRSSHLPVGCSKRPQWSTG